MKHYKNITGRDIAPGQFLKGFNIMFTHKQYKKLATQKNANAWDKTEEKFIFCIDLLDVSAHDDDVDLWVDDLEAWFEETLNPTHPDDSCVPIDD